ncbi:MAG: hypothetical protein JSV88_33330 [Candidatus Aminicenantes bacterium]|nr:MAG: hypothetical protein JSV88_33330 [Candidatus Aminicenantes bacterium]
MMKRKITFISIIAILCGSFVFSSTEFSMEKAKRIDMVLKRVAKYKKPRIFLRKITFTQGELNSYLNLIYLKKYTPEVKYIKLTLKKDNVVDATMKVKLEGKKYEPVPKFLRDIEVEASGKVQCKNYRMRFDFEKLKVNGTSFSPEVLDEAFSAAQVNYKVRKSMYDWFDLMPGIKNIVIDDKKITIFY